MSDRQIAARGNWARGQAGNLASEPPIESVRMSRRTASALAAGTAPCGLDRACARLSETSRHMPVRPQQIGRAWRRIVAVRELALRVVQHRGVAIRGADG